MRQTRRAFVGTSMTAALARGAAVESGISLAAWSFSSSFFAGKWKLLEMPRILRERLQIEGLEHVNQFFENPTLNYLQQLKRNCSDFGVKSLVIMIDSEGSTAAEDRAERTRAAIAHRKWIDIAHFLGCHSVRCNMYGGPEDWRKDPDLVARAAETIHSLLEYAKDSGLNILVENHGRASSDPDILVGLVKKVNHPRFGLMVDLGNWNKGDDRYEAVRKTIRYGKALSVKGSYGPERDPAYDMEKLLTTALEGGYQGWWAIEMGARRRPGEKPTAEELFEREVKTVLGVKAIVNRVVFKQG